MEGYFTVKGRSGFKRENTRVVLTGPSLFSICKRTNDLMMKACADMLARYPPCKGRFGRKEEQRI